MMVMHNCKNYEDLEVKPQASKVIVSALAAMTKLPVEVNIPPVLLKGSPGVGKSQFMLQLAHSLNIPCIAASAMLFATDWLAIPTRGEYDDHIKGIVIEYAYPKFLFEFIDSGTGILVIDELDKLPRELMGSMLTILSERRVGYLTFPNKVLIIAAINPLQAGGYQIIDAALTNRFIHLTFQVDIYEIIHHLRNITSPSSSAFYNITATIDPHLFQHNFVYLSNAFANFLQNNTSIFEVPAEDWSEEHYAYTTPRSFVSLALPALAALVSARFSINNIEFIVPLSSSVVLTLLEGAIGYKNATLLFRYLNTSYDELDVTSILTNPTLFPYSEFDKRLAVIDKIAQHFNANPHLTTLQQIVNLLEHIINTYNDASLATMLVAKIRKTIRRIAKTYPQSDEFRKFIKFVSEHQEIFYQGDEQ